MRRYARETAFKLIFEFLFLGEKREDISGEFIDDALLDESDRKYLYEVYNGVLSHFDELSEKISALSVGFKINRIYKADLSAMLLSAYEILYMPEIPQGVSVSEAVEIVKKYSTESSGSFVNGILSSVIKEGA